MKTIRFCTIIMAILIMCMQSIQGQSSVYYPDGDPAKWNVELTPFLWLPMISGDVNSMLVSETYDVPAVDLLSNLKMAFMMDATVSKGKFFLEPTYIYTNLATENVQWESESGETSVISIPNLKMNILEVVAGGRFQVIDKLTIDPYAGFRFTSYHIFGSVVGVTQTSDFNENKNFWDPVVGLLVKYYPIPRVPVIVRGDVGGFGAGSKFSWIAAIYSGYTLSPSFDLLAGFLAFGADYESEQETQTGSKVGINLNMYGFDLGVTYHIPKRFKDKALFKKAK